MTNHCPEYFRKRFPHLAEEIEDRTKVLSLNSVRTDQKEAERIASSDRAVKPTVIDFVRLCDEAEEAIDIIDFFEKQGKINSEYAEGLRKQLANRGLRSFGSKREPGSYE